MSDPVLPEGTEVVVLEGNLKGEYGVILAYEAMLDQYSVEIDDNLWLVDRYNVAQLDDLNDKEAEDEIESPGFGMSPEDFAAHLEFLITRSLDRVPTVGPSDVFFGYQEFEGMTAEEVLLRLLDKVEEGIAHLAQAHILISRIGISYRTIMKEIIGDDEEASTDE